MFSQRNEKTPSHSEQYSTSLPNKTDPVLSMFGIKPSIFRVIFQKFQPQSRGKRSRIGSAPLATTNTG
jgi:hypothetical protein